jgi:hypothetical protein
MCKGMELAFNQEHQALYIPRCPSVNIFGVDPSVLMQGITPIGYNYVPHVFSC